MSRPACARGWSSIGRTRCARAATRAWIRWASPSRTSTASANGASAIRTARAIDAAAALPDGIAFEGPSALRTLLDSRREQFAATVAGKLLTYALGRGVEYYDQPAVRAVVRGAAASDYRWSSVILGIVKSVPFQMRRAEP